ncbi:hypothetical protein F5148DRAFT_35 [Russula earlei]|uniref:Uncharacterized protein n=1 Tax=Russula earlei TaxID=71964 RepID=A0ACC0UP51_9AGAM|nr:hypothetical protein F5148DRAFT_35 [Russula earlei]
MSSTSIFPNFRLILDAALEYYATQTGIDLTKYPSAHKLQCCGTSEAVLQLLHAREMEFKDYRERNRRLIDFLGPVVQVVHAFSGALSNLASPVPFLPIKTIFVGIDVLLTAAKGVSASYDALVDLFDCMASFLQRLHIYTGIQLDSMMAHILIRVMVEVLSVLALATKQIKQGRLTKFARRLLGERETEAILQRLDRLTQEEALMTVAQTLQVVHGLFNNLKIVMDGGHLPMDGIPTID